MTDTLHDIQKLLAGGEPLKWLFAGDSITLGAIYTFGWRDYTELFSERVRYEMGRGLDCVIKTAISGASIQSLAQHLHRCVIQYSPQVVSINLGMNDCAEGEAGLKNFSTTYAKVIDDIRKASGAAIILHTPQRVLPADKLRLPWLERYVQAVRQLAAQHSTLLIDHYAEWEAAEKSGWMESWMGDSIHPNEYGHRVMANLLMRSLEIYEASAMSCRLFIP